MTIALALLAAACAEAASPSADDLLGSSDVGQSLDVVVFLGDTALGPGPSHCTDGVVSGDESGKDCGGGCPVKCPNGQPCGAPGDCVSSRCVSGTCEALGCSSSLDCPLGTPFCLEGECAECTTNEQCDDHNPCTNDLCQFRQCFQVPLDVPCDDGLYCNGEELCAAGVCQAGVGNPCGASQPCNEAKRTCDECASDADCGAGSTGAWSGCAGFGGGCGEAGTQSRTVTTPRCTAGTCVHGTSQQTQACSRNTDGTICGNVTVSDWSGTCDGVCGSRTRTRTTQTPTCTGGQCQTQAQTETNTCQGMGNGARCQDDGSLCGKPLNCHVCNGNSCAINTPHYGASCQPSCGAAGNLCGVQAVCCAAGASCPLGVVADTYDCARCCNGTCG